MRSRLTAATLRSLRLAAVSFQFLRLHNVRDFPRSFICAVSLLVISIAHSFADRPSIKISLGIRDNTYVAEAEVQRA